MGVHVFIIIIIIRDFTKIMDVQDSRISGGIDVQTSLAFIMDGLRNNL